MFICAAATNSSEVETVESLEWPTFPSSVSRDDSDNSQNSWGIPNGNNFRVRSRQFPFDRSKVKAGLVGLCIYEMSGAMLMP